MVQYFCDRIGVMYLGKLVEVAATDALYESPLHPYSVALLSAIPVPDPRVRKKRLVLRGDVPSPANPPSGCRFHTRCWLRERLGNPEQCSTADPPLHDVGGGQLAACHFADQVTAQAAQEAAATQSVIETATAAAACARLDSLARARLKRNHVALVPCLQVCQPIETGKDGRSYTVATHRRPKRRTPHIGSAG